MYPEKYKRRYKCKKQFIREKVIILLRIMTFFLSTKLLFYQCLFVKFICVQYIFNFFDIKVTFYNKYFHCRSPPISDLFQQKNKSEVNKMRNYKSSDYAINKYSEGIVYKTANQIIEISLDDYLKANPDKTEQDFKELKALSDKIYLEQDRTENRITQKTLFLENTKQIQDVTALTIEENYIEKLDKQYISLAFKKFLKDSSLTEVQKRRFIMHIFKNLSIRKIAEIENVHFTSVQESITSAKRKLKKIFKKF